MTAACGDRAPAEDLTGEAFARAYASWRRVLSIQPDKKVAAVFEINRGAMPRGSVVAFSYTTLSAQGSLAARVVSPTLLSTMPTGCV